MGNKRTARLAWAICVATVAATLIEAGLQLSQSAGMVAGPALAGNLLWAANAIVFAVVGALIVSRQPRNTIGWLMMVFPVGFTVFGPLETHFVQQYLATQTLTPALFIFAWFSTWTWWLIIGPVLLIALLFPTGQPPTPRWRAVVWALGLTFAYFVVVMATFGSVFSLSGIAEIPNPLPHLPASVSNALFLPFTPLLVLVTLLCVAAIFVRYRRAAAVERQQIKWLWYALVAFAAVYALLSLTDQTQGWAEIALPATIILIPLAIGVAILRYRLFDIDVIIRRTLVYSALTALLALAYFGSVLVLQNVFQAVTGESRSALVTVLSTLTIAALFGPLRGRVQRTIDRRFYRQKYDAARTLAAFGAQARDVVELEQLSDQLVRAVDETMQPAHVSLWVRRELGQQPGGTAK